MASAGPKWQCIMCQKTMTGKLVNGLAGKHSDGDGQLCRGSGKPAYDGSKRLKMGSLNSSKLDKVGQSRRQVAQGRGKQGQKAVPGGPRKPRGVAAQRPDMLPAKKSVPGKAAIKKPKNWIEGELHWSTFQDMPRQDLETDAGWRRVRLGAPQGTGRRR